MIGLLRQLIPQNLINNFYHLPKAIIANIIYGFPSKNLKVIGVTGTDGKTTTTNMIYRILKDADKKVSMVSTINAEIAGKKYDTGFHVTSPNPFMVQKFAKKCVQSGDEYLILEVTSHALDQYRFWGINFFIGVITNITHDHLDYHQTWANYFKTKAKLIKDVKVAVLNKDEKHFSSLEKKTSGRVISFGASKSADFNPQGFPLKLKLPGEFNVLNALAATSAVSVLSVNQNSIKKSLENFDSLQGRMQSIENNKGLQIFIDFAHTPNALEQALKTLCLQTKNRLISIFGAAGKRDEQKRPLMGKIAQQLSDIVIVTAEDPRGEQEKINTQIITGARQAGGILEKNLFVIDDRQKAINFAIQEIAKKGDIVAIFGKGHEKSMNLDGKREIFWSDERAVKKALSLHKLWTDKN